MTAWLRKLLFRISPKKKRKSRLLSREIVLLDIEPEKSNTITKFRYWRTTDENYTDHELWEMGWEDAQWHSTPNPRFVESVPYMRGWKEARG